MTDNAGEVFLGLSFGCAQCHDHKFDPILQKDYYRLRAFFTPVRWRDDMKLATDEEKARFAEQQAKWEEATKDIRAQIDAIIEPMIQKSDPAAPTRNSPTTSARWWTRSPRTGRRKTGSSPTSASGRWSTSASASMR